MKRAALELSIGTIVIIVLAMTMLIFGLVLIRTIFTGAKYNVDVMNQKVQDEINKLFTEDKKTVVYLANQKAEIKQGDDYGVAFAIQNIVTGTTQAGEFKYEVIVSDSNLQQKCGVNAETIESWMTTGQSDSVMISSGDKYYGLVRINIPEASPLCIFRMKLKVEKDNQHYAEDFFDVEIKAK